ncbi:MAG: hypothetical protein KBS75_09280 [Bacteroidales bacterium]|nr:hypothetical protein [Candidatus Equimonas faecalis]
MKYIIELEKIAGTDLFRAKGANTLVFDQHGINNILIPYKEKPEVDWYKVPIDTKVIVWDHNNDCRKRYFSHYDGKFFYTFTLGGTSWSTEGEALMCWSHCRLAEDTGESK